MKSKIKFSYLHLYSFVNRKLLSISRPVRLVLVLIFIAAILRLILLPVATYGQVGELYRDLQIIWDLNNNHIYPLLGPSSALGGFYFGAVYYYIEAVFVALFNFRPYGATFSSAFFSVLSLPVLYLLCKRWFKNPHVAILAVGLLTLSLFDIQNAYYVSNPNYLPFFMLVFAYLLTKFKESNSVINYLALGLTLGIATQLHTTALVIMSIMLLAFLIKYKIKPKVLNVILALLVFCVCYLPFIIYEFQNNFALSRALFAIGGEQTAGGSRLGIIGGLFNFFGSILIFKDGSFSFYPTYAPWFFTAIGLAGLIILAMVWLILRKGFRPPQAEILLPGKFILLSWLFSGLAMYLIFPVQPIYYYFLVMWPLPIIVFAWWLNSLYEFSKNYFWFILVCYILLQGVSVGVFYNFIYRPELSDQNIQKIFSEIKLSRQNEYLIINKALDINQFHYYLKTNGLEVSSRPSRGAYTIFEISQCEERNLCLKVEQK